MTTFVEIFSKIFNTINSRQDRVRVIKINEAVYISFSKYYRDPTDNQFHPTKKQYFLPIEYWHSIKPALVELNKFVKEYENGPSGRLSVSGGYTVQTGSGTGSTKAKPFTSIPSHPSRVVSNKPPTPLCPHHGFFKGINVNAFKEFTYKPSHKTSDSIPVSSTFTKFVQEPNFKRQRGRPSKEFRKCVLIPLSTSTEVSAPTAKIHISSTEHTVGETSTEVDEAHTAKHQRLYIPDKVELNSSSGDERC